MTNPIAGKPGTYDRYASVELFEFERRVTTGPGTFTSTFYRYTNAVKDLTYNGSAGADRPAVGAVFIRLPFTHGVLVEEPQGGGSVEFEFDDQEDVIKALALTYDMLDWKVRLWQVGLDAALVITWIDLKIAGRAEGTEWDLDANRDIAMVSVSKDYVDTQILGPKEDYGPNCRFRFKSARCGYSGAFTTCNRTRTQCLERGNQIRFGGFRHSPNPEERIWWGDETTRIQSTR
jgi:hypothetical protein